MRNEALRKRCTSLRDATERYRALWDVARRYGSVVDRYRTLRERYRALMECNGIITENIDLPISIEF